MSNKVEIENIVFCQGDDFIQLCKDCDPNYDPDSIYAEWIDDNTLIEYLLQWWYPGEHSTDIYDADDINTEFLGYERKIDNDTFLLSYNSGLGYAGLSRIVRIFEDQ